MQVGVAVEHQPVGIVHSPHQVEHDRIEENEARLLKEAAAELPCCFDGNVKDGVGELRKRAVRLPSDQSDFGPLVFRYSSEVDGDRGIARA